MSIGTSEYYRGSQPSYNYGSSQVMGMNTWRDEYYRENDIMRAAMNTKAMASNPLTGKLTESQWGDFSKKILDHGTAEMILSDGRKITLTMTPE